MIFIRKDEALIIASVLRHAKYSYCDDEKTRDLAHKKLAVMGRIERKLESSAKDYRRTGRKSIDGLDEAFNREIALSIIDSEK